jgi:hypothetical protein
MASSRASILAGVAQACGEIPNTSDVVGVRPDRVVQRRQLSDLGLAESIAESIEATRRAGDIPLYRSRKSYRADEGAWRRVP